MDQHRSSPDPEERVRRLRIRDVIIDCIDPERLARFWSALLDQPVSARIGPYIWLERNDGVSLGFQAVSERKQGKNRVHLDVTSADPPADQGRVEELGGRRAPGFDDGGFLVMEDPEGNEFCIIPNHPFDVDDDGRTAYLG